MRKIQLFRLICALFWLILASSPPMLRAASLADNLDFTLQTTRVSYSVRDPIEIEFTISTFVIIPLT